MRPRVPARTRPVRRRPDPRDDGLRDTGRRHHGRRADGQGDTGLTARRRCSVRSERERPDDRRRTCEPAQRGEPARGTTSPDPRAAARRPLPGVARAAARGALRRGAARRPRKQGADPQAGPRPAGWGERDPVSQDRRRAATRAEPAEHRCRHHPAAGQRPGRGGGRSRHAGAEHRRVGPGRYVELAAVPSDDGPAALPRGARPGARRSRLRSRLRSRASPAPPRPGGHRHVLPVRQW